MNLLHNSCNTQTLPVTLMHIDQGKANSSGRQGTQSDSQFRISLSNHIKGWKSFLMSVKAEVVHVYVPDLTPITSHTGHF